MNIKRRIKKIESNHNSSGFCVCSGRFPKTEVLLMEIGEWNRRFQTGEETAIRLPDFCEQCRKPIDKSQIETTFEQFRSTVKSRVDNAITTYKSHSDDL